MDLEQLRDHGPYRQFGGPTPRFQASTALRYISEGMNPEGSEEEFSGDTGQPFELPKLPKGMEFGLAGQPPPSLRAVNQGWDAADPPPKSTATPKPETRWIPERRVASDTDSHNQELYSNQTSEQSGSDKYETEDTDIDEYESDDFDRDYGLTYPISESATPCVLTPVGNLIQFNHLPCLEKRVKIQEI
ncbi:hypothetical protein BDV23DRAFT_178009 [Aspergillus alliaceus]|uniref:Uncharacterized protein n=1 Tax=Petromyces alliaceus TaxID=209559 RepID=A0A5N7CP40_PETAA|nr:hypothetical protein BDV23DRAFT_178009 [Aspergillus alliaceus]